MKFRIAAAFLLASLSAASAADKITVKITPNEAYALSLALNNLDGSQRIVTNAVGKETAVLVPFHLGEVRLTIAHDLAALNAKIAEYRAAAAKAPKDADALANAKVEIDLLSLAVSDLSLSANDIPASVLAGLATICPTCIGEEAKKP